MGKFLFVILLLALPVFVLSCMENPVGPGMQNEVTIEILSDRFSPSTVTIEPGTRVIWVNKDTQTHSVDPGTFMNPTQDFEGSGNITPNESEPFDVVFTNPGTINYYCVIHQNNLKEGTIIVQP